MEGWEPAQHVRFLFDENGRQIGETITRDPEWDDEDRALIAGLLQYKSDVCPGCGMYSSDTMWRIPAQDEESIREYFATHPKARYHAFFYTCRGCVAKAKAQIAQDRQDKANQKAQPSLVLYPDARHWLVIDRDGVMFETDDEGGGPDG